MREIKVKLHILIYVFFISIIIIWERTKSTRRYESPLAFKASCKNTHSVCKIHPALCELVTAPCKLLVLLRIFLMCKNTCFCWKHLSGSFFKKCSLVLVNVIFLSKCISVTREYSKVFREIDVKWMLSILLKWHFGLKAN